MMNVMRAQPAPLCASRMGLLLALFLTGCASTHPAPRAEPVAARQARLQTALESALRGFNGTAGVYVKHLGTGEEASVYADTLFPTASMIKVPIMVGVFDAIRRGDLRYDQPLVYRDSLLYEGEDILGSFRDSARIPLSEVQLLSITTSDNTASLWLQLLAGTGTKINEWLTAKGFAGHAGELAHAGAPSRPRALRLGPDDAPRDGPPRDDDPPEPGRLAGCR